jgi:hypothetical protein
MCQAFQACKSDERPKDVGLCRDQRLASINVQKCELLTDIDASFRLVSVSVPRSCAEY